MTRAQAATIIRRVADEQDALVKMVKEDLEAHRVQPDAPTKDEHEVRRTLGRALRLIAAGWENTCNRGSCKWKPEDLLP